MFCQHVFSQMGIFVHKSCNQFNKSTPSCDIICNKYTSPTLDAILDIALVTPERKFNKCDFDSIVLVCNLPLYEETKAMENFYQKRR